ncbi:hypothetical protein [Rhizobium sp. MHM7A]|uniref:hypothetical protein n=1 Tax=Rhizobium sp. MHM7A TaxID=2583233 RepID=UPI0011069C65|nr:hypothetical protein [Rhizobium sp. MHM7A]TLX16666.1 hypothetical protein FFR93_04810 [Rhizobium sp. MHM7A]
MANIVGGLVSSSLGVDEFSWLGWTIDIVILTTALAITIALENIGKKRPQQNNPQSSTDDEVTSNHCYPTDELTPFQTDQIRRTLIDVHRQGKP